MLCYRLIIQDWQGDRVRSRDDIGGQPVFDLSYPVFQKQFTPFEPTDLKLVGLTDGFKRFDRIADVFMLDPKLDKLGLPFGIRLVSQRRI